MADNVVGSVVYKIKGDTSQIDKSLNTTSQKLQGFGKGLSTFVTLPLIGAAGASAKLASDLGESINAVNVVFGDSANTITAWGKNAAEQAGLSKIEFYEASTSIGTLLKKSGKDIDDVALDTIELTRRAADLASVFNTDVSAATTALGAALRGESEPARRFGITLSDAAVQAKALELGLASTKDEITEAIKVQARYALILEESEQVAGDFENTNSETANSARVLKAQIENAAAELGEAFLPVIKDVLGVARDLVTGFNNLDEGGKNLVLILGGIAAAAGPAIQAGTGIYNNLDKIKGILTGPAGVIALIAAAAIAFQQIGEAVGSQIVNEAATKNFERISESAENTKTAVLQFARQYGLSARQAVEFAEKQGLVTEELKAQTQEYLIQQGIQSDSNDPLDRQLQNQSKIQFAVLGILSSSQNQFELQQKLEKLQRDQNISLDQSLAVSQALVSQNERLEEAKGDILRDTIRTVQESEKQQGYELGIAQAAQEALTAEQLRRREQEAQRQAQAEALALSEQRKELEQSILEDARSQIEAAEELFKIRGDVFDVETEKLNILESAIVTLVENGFDRYSDSVKTLNNELNTLIKNQDTVVDDAENGLKEVQDGLGSLLEDLTADQRYDFFDNFISQAKDAQEEVKQLQLDLDGLVQVGLNGLMNAIGDLGTAWTEGRAGLAEFGKSSLLVFADILDAVAQQLLAQVALNTILSLGPLGIPVAIAGAAAASLAAGAIRGGVANLDSRQVGGDLVPLGGQLIQVNEGPTQERITVEQTTAQSQRGNAGGELRLVVSGGSDSALGQLISRMIQNGQIRGELR